jgi:hypothetical protein
VKYLLLINKDEAAWRALSDDERAAVAARYAAYGRKMMEAGVLRGGAMLEPVESATTVRVRGGKRMVTDGPFAETVEQIAGVAIMELDNLDQAIEWAAGHPDAAWASVEIRPIVPWDEQEGR